MIYYYLITALLTGISLIALVLRFEKSKVNLYFLLLVLLLALSNGGYLSIALATNVNEAVLANKICYLGGCFTPPLILLLICTICNYHVPSWLKIGMFLYSFTVYGMVLTIGINGFYYESVYLEKYGNATVLGHTYGPGHGFFYVILYGYMAIQIVLLSYSIIKKKKVSRKNLWALVVVEVLSVILFIAGRMINPAIEIMPLVYVLSSWIFFYMCRNGMMYNIEDSISTSLKKQETYGYILVDTRLNYLGCNDAAVKIFPGLSEGVVDRTIKNIPGLEIVIEWINAYAEGKDEKITYETESRHFECQIDPLIRGKKVHGYMLELREDTDNWKYMKLLATHNLQLEEFQRELENKVDEQTEELQMQQKRIRELFVKTVTALSEAVDAKDRYTSGHSRRVAEYSRMIAARLGKDKEEQDEIYRAGLLHDMGKIRVPAEIINKPGKLTDDEYNIIKIHPVTGYHILKGISENSTIAVAARYHHERYDGKGYPNGLSGEKIPEVARILGVADAYDAMASNRSYRNALPQEVVRAEIEKGMGTQFDPKIASIMLQMIDEDKNYSMKQKDSKNKKILTVDDEAINNKIVAHIMSDEPMYEVVSAMSGKEALDILEQQSFDLILLDLKMPQMDGLETLKRIREKWQTPVVFMTSDKTLDFSVVSSEYGCDEQITKPFLPLLVKEVVYNMTEKNTIEN
ncbi:MAG: response regulator [Lachnospiraceae bacterium]|nr:response regulator [Lachnospiraceae bacterium]